MYLDLRLYVKQPQKRLSVGFPKTLKLLLTYFTPSPCPSLFFSLPIGHVDLIPDPNFEYGVELAIGIVLGGEGDLSRNEVLGLGVGDEALEQV